MTQTTLYWFRQDLRLQDNPALVAAANSGQVLPVYILDDKNAARWRMGGASRWWLHQSLTALDESLGGKLWVFSGDPKHILPQLIAEHDICTVHWNRCYEPWRVKRDEAIKSQLQKSQIDVHSHNASMLWEPWQNLKSDGTAYKVFTPYYRNGLKNGVDTGAVLADKPHLELLACEQPNDKIAALELLPDIPWYTGFPEHFSPGESAAQNRLKTFLNEGLADYKAGRDYPAMEKVSRLSPHLHFGEIAPHRAWQEAAETGLADSIESAAEHFQRELAWREFSYSLLFHFPHLTEANMNAQFDDFPWQQNTDLLQAWQQGRTGYPLVDAGMRELWTTGYMHNRVRMIVGSFLVKNLMQHWQHGANWFWDCLLDADLANNTCSWQWVAGCGADAAPYFRVFNPITQSQKFATESYIRRYVPELAALPDRHIHEPASAPAEILATARVKIGQDYPAPIVDLKQSRARALDAYKDMRAEVS